MTTVRALGLKVGGRRLWTGVSSCRDLECREEERIADQWLWARDWCATVAMRTESSDWWEESGCKGVRMRVR